MKPKIHVILGSIRSGRSGDKVVNWFMNAVKDNPSAELELIDLRDYPLPMFADADLPSRRQGKHENPEVQRWLDKVDSADGYIIITPEYNHSYTSALKNALDYPYKEWNGKPIGFIGYGGLAGGSRAVEHLRQIAAELQMYDVRDSVLIPAVWAAFDDQGNLANGETLAKTANSIVDSVAALAQKVRSSEKIAQA